MARKTATLATLLVAFSALSQTQDTASSVYRSAAKSTFLLIVKSPEGKDIAQGTGFVIEDGKVITNEHVARSGTVYIDFGAARLPLKLERVDAFNDLALLSSTAEISAPPLRLSSALPQPGAAVYAIGNPEGLERSISTGVVAGIREFDGRKLIQVTAPISHGSSGGPIMDSRGEVIGVAVGILREGQNLNFAVAADAVARLLRGETNTKGDVAAALEKVDGLIGERSGLKFSPDTDAERQRLHREIEDLLRGAVGKAGNDAGLLLQIATMAKAEFSFDIAIDASERALRLDTKSPEATHFALAEALYWKAVFTKEEEGKQPLLERAEKEARAAIRRGFVAAGSDRYELLGDVLEDRGRQVEAQAFFRQSLDASRSERNVENEAGALRRLARVAHALKQYGDSRRWFDALARTGQATAFDWASQGARLDEQQRYHEAGDSYRTAASTGAAWTNWCEAGGSFAAVDEYDEELACNRKCVEEGTGKDGSEEWLAVAHRQIAVVLNERGVYEEALAHAKEATTLNAADAWAFEMMAEALISLGRFEQAINTAKQAIRLSDGKFATMHFHLGAAYFETENWEMARQSFEKAAQLNPKDSAAAYNVALCFAKLHYYQDAASWYEEVLRREPDHKDRQRILDTIRQLRQ